MKKQINDLLLKMQNGENCIGETANQLLDLFAVSGSLSFKEQMKQDIIPRVWQMAEKEKEHLNWLIDNNAPKDMIETSQCYLSHFRQRYKEYIEYVNGL